MTELTPSSKHLYWYSVRVESSFSRGTRTVSFLPLDMGFGHLCVCTGSTLSVLEVKHRPKAIARVDKVLQLPKPDCQWEYF